MAQSLGPEATTEEYKEIALRTSEFRRTVKVFFGRKLAVFGLVVITILILTAIFAPWLAPYNPYIQHLSDALSQPGAKYLLGTDALGRDTLSRIIYGSRISLIVGLTAVTSSAVIGQSLGLVAAYFGGVTNTLIMRSIDTLMAIPQLLLVLLIASTAGGGMLNVIIALSIGMIPVHCRLSCGLALTVKQNDYITAQKSMGAGNLRVILKHIFPNVFPSLLVLMTMELGIVILMEASLSFLGVGIVPPTPTWGSMVNEGRRYLLTNPILSISPGIAIMLVVFGFNMMGDGLRDALDPRLRGTF